MGDPLQAGPSFVATFHTPGDPEPDGYSYGASHQPGWTALERAIGELEVDSGHEPAGVRVFGSGQGASAAALGAVLESGDTIVIQAAAYYGTRKLLDGIFVPAGVKVRVVPFGELASTEALRGAKMVWIETPANPRLEITDLRAVVAAAKTAGAMVAVDNTMLTPLGQRPLELGADLSVCSGSKAMGGHHDLLMGHVAARDADLLAKVDRQRGLTGGILGAMESWLALRSLATLPLRLERMAANAFAVALLLNSRSEVREVLYAGLTTHPGHAIAREQMRWQAVGWGPVVSFALPSKEAAMSFLARAELVTEATSFGGIMTTAERRARWGHDQVAAGFIRLSVGCEDVEDLIDDLGRALSGL